MIIQSNSSYKGEQTMIKDLDEHLVGIAIGVRFRPNFSIEDQLGRIADTILYSENSFFDPSVFPRATTSAPSKELLNEDTGDRLFIDHSNIILELYFGSDLHFVKEDLQNILDNFDEQVIKGVLRELKIKEVVRMGYIRRYVFDIESLASSFVEKTIGNTLGGVNDINLNFSKRIPSQEALVKEDIADYDNAIFTIKKKASENEIFMALDYQSFYDPFLQTADLLKFRPFIETATQFNKRGFLKWLNENYVEGQHE